MTILLPPLPRFADVTPALLDNSADLSPPTGGDVQNIGRLGNKYSIEVALPKLEPACARAWMAAQLRSKTELVPLRLAWPQTIPGLPLAAVIDGAGQAGSQLAVRGLTPGTTVPAFAFFSFEVGGRSYLHATSAEAVANGAGKALLPIGPLLRIPTSDGLALNFLEPVIEGRLPPGSMPWTLKALTWIGVGFTLTEIR